MFNISKNFNDNINRFHLNMASRFENDIFN